jgi:exopolysaccharide production protein ExoZ
MKIKKKSENVIKEHSIEVIRFVAATAVVFAHIPYINIGYFGVDLFFIVSGFVMMLSTEISKKKFFLKRLFRILPTYYFFTIGVFLIALLYPDLLNNTTADFSHLIKSFLFIPFDKNGAGHFPVLFLGWTLNYEMYFYLIFAISLMLSFKNRSLVATGILTLIFILCKNHKELPFVVYGDLIAFEFVIGMIIYEAIIKKNNLNVVFLTFAILIVVLINENSFSHRLIKYGLPSALFCSIMIIIFKEKKIHKMLLTFGGASYSLYLIHPYIIQFFLKNTNSFSSGYIETAAISVVSILVANIAAIIVYKYLEIPMQSYLRRKFIYN